MFPSGEHSRPVGRSWWRHDRQDSKRMGLWIRLGIDSRRRGAVLHGRFLRRFHRHGTPNGVWDAICRRNSGPALRCVTPQGGWRSAAFDPHSDCTVTARRHLSLSARSNSPQVSGENTLTEPSVPQPRILEPRAPTWAISSTRGGDEPTGHRSVSRLRFGPAGHWTAPFRTVPHADWSHNAVAGSCRHRYLGRSASGRGASDHRPGANR